VNTVSRYNRIYHSQKQIASTDKQIKESYKDDFNKILPIINLGNESSLKGNGGDMDKVLKKTSRVIEKHPKSKWTDDAWFLMGQSYFYRGDMFAAIETFEFVSSKYKKTDIAYRANLWTLYSYIIMGKESESLAIISKLKNEKSFPKAYKKGLYASAADIAIKQGKPTLAIENLLKALPMLKKKDEKIRYNFVLAQLYQNADSFEKATYHYKKVIKYNPPYDFNFNAQINMASSLVRTEGQSYKKAKSVLSNMLKDDKNIEYYSKIYFELGKIDELSNNSKLALTNYKKALHENGSTGIIKTDAYNAIGNIYFSQKNFLEADKYFDSANQTLDQNHPDFDQLSKARENQSDLLNYLVTIQTNDSLLMLADNPDKLEREIDRQIELEKRRLKALENAKLNSSNLPPAMTNNPFLNGNNNNAPTASANASFPFYDASLRARGVNDFTAKWGDRKLNDNWRVSSIASNSADNFESGDNGKDSAQKEDPKIVENNSIPANIAEDRKKYYQAIPYTNTQKEKLNKENEIALFELGILHLYGLEQPDQGIIYLEKLQKRYPKHNNQARAIYEMAKYYKSVEQSAKYNEYYDKLARNYPESNYLKILKNQLISESESSKKNVGVEVQKMYDQAYQSYKAGNYPDVLNIKKRYDAEFAGNALQSNFEYLEALTYARTQRLDEYKTKLEQIVANYPNTLVGENASHNLLFLNNKPPTADSASKQTNPNVKDSFTADNNAVHYSMLVFPAKGNTNRIKNDLNDYHKRNYSLKVIELTEFIIEDHKCIIIKGLENLQSNLDYINVLQEKSILPKNSKLLYQRPISAQNMGTLINTKNLDGYLKFANSQYKS